MQTTGTRSQAEERLTLAQRWANWKEVILSCNLSAGKRMDTVSKWLVLTRACVFSMTLTSGLIGGLLAVGTMGVSGVNWLYLALAVVGIALAHASNNLINDYFDLAVGLDSSEGYARAEYAPHPIISGLSSKREMLTAILIFNLIDAAIMIYLTIQRGPLVLAFALAGLFISVFYTAPPIRLKQLGLGEIGVAIVWGPLMIGGTYYAAAGDIPLWVMVASIPYALLVMTVLIGKHVDKLEKDKEKGIHTLPVILGEMASLRLNQILFVAFYPFVFALVLTGQLSVWMLLTLLSVPMLIETLKIYNEPKPDEPPEDYAVWPLWFVSIAFRFTRLAGGTFLLGLILHIIYPITINVL